MGKDQDLFQAIRDGDPSAVQKILTKLAKPTRNKLISSNKKFNINYQDNDGMSYLHQAALMGNTDIMQLLLENSMATGLKDNKGMIPLHYASWQGKTEPVHLLLEHNSPVGDQADDGATPLHLACQHGNFDVVNFLLCHHADPSLTNKHNLSPLDLACEFGRYRVVEQLIKSNQCQRMLEDGPQDMLDNSRTTCLHLAARNGHTDIVKLLLQAGVNINRSTLQGTCLHEAALFGKTDVVRLLLECGADVNKPNSYDQTALDIVNKFTTTKGAKDLKQILKEASFAVQARAVKDYNNIYDPQSLIFKEGECIKVLEQKPNGIWKGSVIDDGRMSKTGYFPADHVVLVDSQAISDRPMSQQYPQSKKIPPQVPDLISRSPGYSTSEQRTSFGSIGTDDSFPPLPPSPRGVPVSPTKDCIVDISFPPLSLPTSVGNVPCSHIQAKVVVNQVGDYGDWPAPGNYNFNGDMRGHKDSPTSSNRNSAASTDSGRGISTGQLDGTVAATMTKNVHNFVNVQITNQHRLSSQSYESGVSSRQSYHSTSSSSMGSLDRLEESGYSSQVNVAELVHKGVPDSEVLLAWLRDLHYDEYYHNFTQAGYDMPTISRMTPEDLTAIGITKPGHRKRLKAEIARMNIYDGIPDYKPNDLYEWLRILTLDQYHDTLLSQGYSTIDQMTEITWEDLEEIGIQKLGHQKKIMLAIDRLKRVMSGMKRLSSMEQRLPFTEPLEPPATVLPSSWSAEIAKNGSQCNQVFPMAYHKKSASGDSLTNVVKLGDLPTFTYPKEGDRSSGDSTPTSVSSWQMSSSGVYQPDVVAIQVKRSSSHPGSDSSPISENTDMAGHPITYQSFHMPSRQTQNLAEKEFPGTNGQLIIDDTGADVPHRPSVAVSPRVLIKPKPVAKITAKTKQMGREPSPEFSESEKYEWEDNSEGVKGFRCAKSGHTYPGSLKPIPLSNTQQQEHIYDQPQVQPPKSPKPLVLPKPQSPGPPSPLFAKAGHHEASIRHFSSPAGKSKKVPPPPPPKRSNSVRHEEQPDRNDASKPKSLVPTAPAQHQDFADCVKSLSERFGKKMEDKDSQDSSSNESDEFPPPPPPIAMDIITPKIHNYGIPIKCEKSGTEVLSSTRVKKDSCPLPKDRPFIAQKPSYNRSVSSSSDSLAMESILGVTVKRNDSALSVDSNASSSSVDSNTLPFANENIGTIKQKNSTASKPSVVQTSEASDGHRNIYLNANMFDDDRRSADLRTSTVSQQSSVALSRMGFREAAETVPKRPTLPKKYEGMVPTMVKDRLVSPVAEEVPLTEEQQGAEKPKRSTETGDVLCDIDNMLQDLTEELDAMLES